MMWVFAILVGLVLGVVATVAAGKVGHLPPAETSSLPARDVPLDAEALRTTRFSLALRGYRMDEVDALLDRVAAEWDSRPHRNGREVENS